MLLTTSLKQQMKNSNATLEANLHFLTPNEVIIHYITLLELNKI